MLAKGAETLPNKVAHDYKALAKLYDAKNYKKGLKNAEKILQSHPDHPETLAMKALFELGLGEEGKAEVDAKMALMKSKMMSMFCWHTYGTILKQKKNFFEAAKCFQQASNFQKDNMQILRQTASLQIQVRDHFNHVATRWKILQQKPNMIYNWAAFAVANHLKGDFEQLYKALSSIDNLRLSIQMKPVETSHYFIYRAIAFRDGLQFQKMYDDLKKNKAKILDEDIWNELMFKSCQKLGKQEEAKECIEKLLKKFPENLEYIEKYRKFTGLTGKDVNEKMISEFSSKISKVYLLCYIEDAGEFKQKFEDLIRPYFQRNLISLFTEIQVLYQRTPHQKVIEEVFLEHEASLKENKYPDGTVAAFPTEYLWSLYLLSQHYSRDFITLKQAFAYICKAIEHTNTVSEFYMTKADIEYKLHNNLEALQTINEGRKTDLADRYMNNICVKYLFKCQKPQKAEEMLKLFMRDEASLYELQTQWYIIEAGKAFLKMKDYNAGLRHLNFIDKQFKDMEANQYDFHTYCVRKWTLKEYIELIAFNDNLYCNKKYAEAAGTAMEYLPEYVHHLQVKEKQPPVEEDTKDNEGDAKKKKKKKNKKVTNEPEELPPSQAFRKKIDYNGTEYAESIKANPLNEALTYAQNITSAQYFNKANISENKKYCKAFANAVKTFIEFNKPLLVIKALKKLLKTQVDAYTEHYWSVKSIIYLNQALENEKIAEISKEFIKQYLKELNEGKSVEEFHGERSKQLPENLLKPIKMGEIELAVGRKDSRDNFLCFYKKQLSALMGNNDKSPQTMRKVFYLVHKLEFYNQLSTELKTELNSIFGEETTYFSNWVQKIDCLPESFWSLFWLSPYDQKREEEAQKEEDAKTKSIEAHQKEGAAE